VRATPIPFAIASVGLATAALLLGCGLDRGGLGGDSIGPGDAPTDDTGALDAAATDTRPPADTSAVTDATDASDTSTAAETSDASDGADAADAADAPDVIDAPDALDAFEAGPCAAPVGATSSAWAVALPTSPASWIEVGALAIPADFTIEAWVFPTATGERVIVSKDKNGDGNNQFRLGLSGGKAYFMETDASGNDGGLWKSGAYQLASPSALPLSKWTHVAVTKAGKAFSLLIDGVVVKSFTASATITHAGTQPFRIGAREAADALVGAIDEVRLWNVARTADAIACDRARGVGPGTAQYASLVAYWPIDDGSGTKVHDALGLHDGTFSGSPGWSAPGAF
jgi:hypothetical protein